MPVYPSDIPLDFNDVTVNAIYNEFRYLQTLPYFSIFYIEKDDGTVIPFRGFAFGNSTHYSISAVNISMRIKVLFEGNLSTWIPVDMKNSQLYFSTTMLNLSDYIQPILTHINYLSTYIVNLNVRLPLTGSNIRTNTLPITANTRSKPLTTFNTGIANNYKPNKPPHYPKS